MTKYHQELTLIHQALFQASQRLKAFTPETLHIHIKKDGTPVTNADIEVDRMIKQTVREKFPGDGWLSEETPDRPDRLQSTRVWVLDPIDGTKPFLKALPQFTISLALVMDGHPIIGTLFNPATQEYFCAVHPSQTTLNGHPVHVRTTPQTSMTFLVNRWQFPKPLLENLKKQHRCPSLLGSIAYSLGLVATGQVDGVINFSQQNEWDIAAAKLLVERAGGLVLNRHLQPIFFNQPHPVVDGIVAIRPEALPHIKELLKIP